MKQVFVGVLALLVISAYAIAKKDKEAEFKACYEKTYNEQIKQLETQLQTLEKQCADTSLPANDHDEACQDAAEFTSDVQIFKGQWTLIKKLEFQDNSPLLLPTVNNVCKK